MGDSTIPTTNFGIELDTYFKNLPYNEKEEVLHFHQYILNKFMIEKNRRGILVYHTMGFGKTILATSIIEEYRKHEPNRKAVILLPKSLQNNFVETLRGYIQTTATSIDNSGKTIPSALDDDAVIDIIEEHYNFVSSNASNMYTQIGQLDKTTEEIEFEKNIGLFTEKLGSGSLENSVLVIDEFHNLSNAISNRSKNGLKLYNEIMKTNDIKIILLTGTPIINHPFELVSTLNILHGSKLFPENIRDFITFYIDRPNYSIKNKTKFQNRITGLVSYYGSEYFEGVNPGFPEELPIKIEHVPMSKEQFAKYLEMREIEKKEESRKIKFTSNEDVQFNDKGSASSSYRIRSRQVSNFLIPAIAIVQRGAKAAIKDISRIPISTFKQLDIYSPKSKRILENINKHKGQLQLVFSQFTSAEGLTTFSKVLDQHGFEQWSLIQDEPIKLKHIKKVDKLTNRTIKMEDDDAESDQDEITGGNVKRKYAMYSGDIPTTIRNKIIEIFNSKENMHGELIEIILVSNQTGGLGLDLRGVRAIHIMEPYWNWALILQIIGRGARFNSHSGYPAAEKNVQPYMYMSVFPKSYIPPSKDDDSKYTTDMHLYLGAMNNRKLSESFLMTLIEASVDCSIHHKKLSATLQKKIKCHLCIPNNKPLYDADFYKDMAYDAPNPCQSFTAKKISTEEIIFTPPDGDKSISFYYNKVDPTNIKIFEYNDGVEGYIPINPSHPYYSDLIKKILNI